MPLSTASFLRCPHHIRAAAMLSGRDGPSRSERGVGAGPPPFDAPSPPGWPIYGNRLYGVGDPSDLIIWTQEACPSTAVVLRSSKEHMVKYPTPATSPSSAASSSAPPCQL